MAWKRVEGIKFKVLALRSKILPSPFMTFSRHVFESVLATQRSGCAGRPLLPHCPRSSLGLAGWLARCSPPCRSSRWWRRPTPSCRRCGRTRPPLGRSTQPPSSPSGLGAPPLDPEENKTKIDSLCCTYNSNYGKTCSNSPLLFVSGVCGTL